MPRHIGEHLNVTIELHRQYVTGCSVCDENALVSRIRDHGVWIGKDVDLPEEVWLRRLDRKGQQVGHDLWRGGGVRDSQEFSGQVTLALAGE